MMAKIKHIFTPVKMLRQENFAKINKKTWQKLLTRKLGDAIMAVL